MLYSVFPKSSTIYFLRHSPVKNAQGLCYGQSDLDTDESFTYWARESKEALQRALEDLANPYRSRIPLVSSPLKRCVKLADFLSKELDYLEVLNTDDHFKELNFGRLENRLWQDIPEEESRDWMNNYHFFPCPEGESLPQMQQRIFLGLENYRRHGAWVLCAHAGVYRCLRILCDRLSPQEALAEKPLAYGTVHCFTIPWGQSLEFAGPFASSQKTP